MDVVMTTYFPPDVPERQEYAKETLRSLILNLSCEDNMRLVIADDTEGTFPQDLLRTELETLVTRTGHKGIGASLNLALRQVADVWMYTTDDWVLTHPLNLNGPLALLRGGYDLVRLGPIHPDLCCVTRFSQNIGWWLDLLPHYGGFAFATRPFVATKDFYTKVGPFSEGLNSYETERLYAERVSRLPVKLAYWGSVDLAGPWYHCGTENVGYRDL